MRAIAIQIPEYGQQVNLNDAPGTPNATVHAINTGVGNEIEKDAGELMHVAAHFKNQNDLSAAIKATSDANLADEERFQSDVNKAQPGAPNFTPDQASAYDKLTEDFAQKLTSPGAQQKFRDQRAANRDNFLTRSLHFEQGEARRNRSQSFVDAADNNGNQLYTADKDSRDNVYAQNRKMFEDGLAEAALPPEEKQKLRDEWKNKNSFAGVQADLRDRPEVVQPNLLKGVTEKHADGIPDSYFSFLGSVESSNNPTAQATTSSAYGKYQFTSGHWESVIKAHPELGLSTADRYKPEAQEIAIRADTADNKRILEAQGLPVNATTLYMVHFLGVAGGPKFLKGVMSDPTADARQFVGSAAAEANPGIFNGRNGAEVLGLFSKKFGNVSIASGATGSSAPSYYADIPVQKRDAYYAQAETELRKRQTLGEAAFKQQVENALSEYGSTGVATHAPTEQEFVAALGPQRGTVAAGEFQANATAQAAGYQVQRMPLSEGMQYVETLKPAQGDPFYAEKMRGYTLAKTRATEVQKAVISDFGAHVVSVNPEAKAALEKAMSSQDPSETRDAMTRYASIMQTEGDRMGVPASRRSFLPKAYSDEVAAQLNQKLTSDAQAGAVVQQLNAFKDRFGDNWPKVYSELQNNMSGPVQVITSNIQPRAAQILASVHDKSFEDLAKTLDKTAKRDTDTYLQTEFQQFKTSVGWQQSSLPTVSTFYEQAKKLSAVYQSQGDDAKTAAGKAYNDLIGFKFRMVDTSNVNARIPVTQDQPNLEAQMKQEFQNIIKSDAIMPGTYETGVLGVDKAKANIEGWLQRNAKWVTLPDNSGVGLFAGGNLILDSAGRKVMRTWEQLKGIDVQPQRDLGPLHPSAPGKDASFTERMKGTG